MKGILRKALSVVFVFGIGSVFLAGCGYPGFPQGETESLIKDLQVRRVASGYNITLSYGESTFGNLKVEVYDVDGNLVKQIYDNAVGTGSVSFLWDGTDLEGNKVAPGVYLVRAEYMASAGVPKTETYVWYENVPPFDIDVFEFNVEE